MLKTLCALLLALALPLTALAESAAFRLGVAPHTSPRVILEMYQPLRQQLEQALGISVEVQTATDFTEFARRALNQEYDLAITTGHQARLYQTDAGYLPLLTYSAEFKAVAVVARDSKFRQPADLQGATLLGLSPSSLVTQWGQHWLKSKGLSTENLQYVSAADSVSQQVLAGQASLAFTSLANFQKLPAAQQGALRLLAESEPLLGRVYMLNKRWAGQHSKLEQTILRFGLSPAGQHYLTQNKLNGYRKPKMRELEAMEPYAAETRLQIKAR
jgi:phosphonate transport system substrate-binding protein